MNPQNAATTEALMDQSFSAPLIPTANSPLSKNTLISCTTTIAPPSNRNTARDTLKRTVIQDEIFSFIFRNLPLIYYRDNPEHDQKRNQNSRYGKVQNQVFKDGDRPFQPRYAAGYVKGR